MRVYGKVTGFDLREMDWKKVPYLRRTLGVVLRGTGE